MSFKENVEFGFTLIELELQHDKTNKMTFAPSEDSDKPGHQSLRCPHEEALGLLLPIERTAKTDQTVRMSRLI